MFAGTITKTYYYTCITSPLGDESTAKFVTPSCFPYTVTANGRLGP